MQASDGLRQTGYAVVMILLMLALFFLLVGDGGTAGILAAASAALTGLIEWIRFRLPHIFGRDNAGVPRG